MGTSKQLITALEKSDWLDRVLILSAFAFFVLVILFILKQRILDRGLRVALWWTKFLPDFSGDSALLQADRAEKAFSISPPQPMLGASTVVASAISSLATAAAAASVNVKPSQEATVPASEFVTTDRSQENINDEGYTIVSGPNSQSSTVSGERTAESLHIEL